MSIKSDNIAFWSHNCWIYEVVQAVSVVIWNKSELDRSMWHECIGLWSFYFRVQYIFRNYSLSKQLPNTGSSFKAVLLYRTILTHFFRTKNRVIIPSDKDFRKKIVKKKKKILVNFFSSKFFHQMSNSTLLECISNVISSKRNCISRS